MLTAMRRLCLFCGMILTFLSAAIADTEVPQLCRDLAKQFAEKSEQLSDSDLARLRRCVQEELYGALRFHWAWTREIAEGVCPLYLLNTALWKAIWPIPDDGRGGGCCLSLVRMPEISWRDRFWILLSFSMLGLITGVLAGLSRQPVIGAMLPPVLSLVGGLAIYLIGKDGSNRMLVTL